MARRRMISQDIISDEHFNLLSLEAQNIFIRMLTVSDDCGVVPAGNYKLNVLINTPSKLSKKIDGLLQEIVNLGLGHLISYKGESFFVFKPQSFQDYQSYILKKATKSEYLRISKEEFEELSKKFQEIPRDSIHNDKSGVSTVDSRKYTAESKEQQEPKYFEAIFYQHLPEENLEDWKTWIDYCYAREDVKLNRVTVIPMLRLLKENQPKIKEIIKYTTEKNAKGLIVNLPKDSKISEQKPESKMSPDLERIHKIRLEKIGK